jgi:hypothetical protein
MRATAPTASGAFEVRELGPPTPDTETTGDRPEAIG